MRRVVLWDTACNINTIFFTSINNFNCLILCVDVSLMKKPVKTAATRSSSRSSERGRSSESEISMDSQELINHM